MIFSPESTLARADTTRFTPNISEGWDIYSSYLHNEGDSVEFEVILKRHVPSSNKWVEFSQIGTIDSVYFPAKGQLLIASEPDRVWDVSIQADGKCLIKLKNGPDPEGANIVLPLKMKYEK